MALKNAKDEQVKSNIFELSLRSIHSAVEDLFLLSLADRSRLAADSFSLIQTAEVQGATWLMNSSKVNYWPLCCPLVVIRYLDLSIAPAVSRLLLSAMLDVAVSVWSVILLHQHHRRLVQQLVLAYC